MNTSQQIIADLRLIMEANQQLELLNIYKGVPIIYKASIIAIKDDTVRIKVDDPAVICLEYDKQTRILGNDYFDPASAQVDTLDIHQGLVDLHSFSYTGTKLGDRMIVRVVPKEETKVRIVSEGEEILAIMADISISGIGIRIANSEYSPILKPGTAVQMGLSLPGGDIEMGGMVLSVTKTSDYHRLSIRFVQLNNQKTLIFRYLIDRRAEIQTELQNEYTRQIEES